MASVGVTCLFALWATLAVQVASRDAQTPTTLPRCFPGLIVDCNLRHEDLVWSKDENNECITVLNKCLFEQANCARYRQERPLLEQVSKAECQSLCVNDCSQAPKDTVCVHRGEKYCTFPSQCEWRKHLCNTGEFWFQEGPRPCGSNPVPCIA
ncbi:uncharacterized protein LOC129250298 [Anastrepha obliqua]|uniref:uncharacterized protein LOC129250298 n=1 Tax=Anastrepha obliqua TaxID=95512 RepID=UPI00240A3887|nr:uncharacterized protein LOC129250298 [Anastrepha obliqua]